MADVSKLRANINGVFETYDIKDPVARQIAEAAASLTVDSALSDTSTNPVQNKVITGEVTQLKSHLEAVGLSVVDGAINITYEEG